MKSTRPSATRLVCSLLTLPLAAGGLLAQETAGAGEPEPASPANSPGEASAEATEAETPPVEEVAEEPTEGTEAPAAQSSEAEETATEASSEEATESAPEPGELKNWVEVGVGGTFLNGYKPAFQQRYGRPDGPWGGVDGFHYEQVVGEEGLFQVDGRGLFDLHDYELTFDFAVPEKGFLRAGYRESRSWYDGSGGYFPGTDAWFPLYGDTLTYDQRQVFVEAGLRLPKLPQFTVRYEHTEREGQKGSTIWGDTNDTGGLGPRSIVPTLLDLDRVRDLVKADLAHTFGITAAGVGFRYDRQDNDDARLMRRSPGEGPASDRHVTQRDQSQADLFNVHAHTVSRFNDKFWLSAGYAFTDLDSGVSGYRVYGSAFDPDYAQRLPNPGTYDQLIGGSLMQQHVGNLNLMAKLTDKLVLVPSLRVEGRDTEGSSSYLSPAAPYAGTAYGVESQRGLLDVTEALDLRYTGVTNWVFYARGSWLQGSGDLEETRVNEDSGALVLDRETEDRRFAQKYAVGANWYPWRRFSLGTEYYHKRRDNDYDHGVDTTANLPGSANRYPAFFRAQHLVTDDVNVRATWRPRGNLTLVGRYDLQLSTIDTQPDGLPELQTSDLVSHIGSGSVSWVPWARLYVLGSLSYVWDRTTTPATDLWPSVQDAENHYWTGNATLGYALDDKTDLEGQYLFYRADNYSDDSAYGQPFGAGAEDHGVTAGLVRRISPRVRLSLKYGFFTGHDQLSGGNRDYDAHLIYSTLQYRF